MKPKPTIAFVIFNTFASPKRGIFWGDLATSLWSGALKKAGIQNDILVILLKHGARLKNTKILNSFLSYCKTKRYKYIFLPSEWSAWLVRKAKKVLDSELYFLQSPPGDKKAASFLNRKESGNFFYENFTPNFSYDKFFGVTPSPQETIPLLNYGCPQQISLENNPFYKDLKEKVASLENNPFYKGLKGKLIKKWMGCTYCSAAIGYLDMPIQKKTRRLKRELIYLQKSLPNLKEVTLTSPEDFFKSFIRVLPTIKIKPLGFHIQLRPDVIVKRKKEIEAILKIMKKKNFYFHVALVGFENFSKRELLIFNRGYQPEMNIKALEVLRDLRKIYPETFVMKNTVASFILFEPLTTINDLKINIKSILKLKDAFKIFKDLNFNRVRIDRDMILYYLIKKRGLILPELSSQRQPQEELSNLPRGGYWKGNIEYRFKSSRVKLIYQIWDKYFTLASKEDRANKRFKLWVLKKILTLLKPV